jgi:hypothetical protein
MSQHILSSTFTVAFDSKTLHNPLNQLCKQAKKDTALRSCDTMRQARAFVPTSSNSRSCARRSVGGKRPLQDLPVMPVPLPSRTR